LTQGGSLRSRHWASKEALKAAAKRLLGRQGNA
jgi:hypothetical protein